MRRKSGLAVLAFGLVCLVGLAILALVRPADEARQGRPFAVELESAAPTTSQTTSVCSLPTIVTIARGPRLRAVSRVDNPIGAACVYLFRAGQHGRECLLEFPTAHAAALRADSLVARIADSYYSHRQGGIMFPVISESTSTFLMLDARWCTLLGAADGFSVGEAL